MTYDGTCKTEFKRDKEREVSISRAGDRDVTVHYQCKTFFRQSYDAQSNYCEPMHE